MKLAATHRQQAFTMVEGLVVAALVLLLLAIFLPALEPPRHHASKEGCLNNLKQVGISYRIWAEDHGDKYPMDVPVAQGGAQELIATGNVAGFFQVMSNELSTPKILICMADRLHQYATNFDTLSRSNISFFISLSGNNSLFPTVLSGDANVVLNGRAVSTGFINLWSNSVSWTPDRHSGYGYVLLGDGSVQRVRQMGFTSSTETYFATNRIVVP